MLAAPSLSSSSSSTSASSHLFRERAFRRCFSLPPLRTAGSTQIPRVSASCAAAAERVRDDSGHSYYYSRGYGGRGGTATATATATVSAPGTLYDVLGVAAGATAQEIKAAYRRLARACHPDVVATGRKGASADEFMRVHAAYATLSDPDKRAEYDRRTTAARWRAPYGWTSPSYGSAPSPAPPNSPSPSPRFSRRTWETDQCW